MKDLWVVASYTIKDMLKKKTFIISNLIIFIIIIYLFCITIKAIKRAILSKSKYSFFVILV